MTGIDKMKTGMIGNEDMNNKRNMRERTTYGLTDVQYSDRYPCVRQTDKIAIRLSDSMWLDVDSTH